MASKYQGSVAGTGTPKYIRGGKYSPQMQNLVELLNVGPLQEDIVSDVYSQMRELYNPTVDENVVAQEERTAQLDKTTGEVFTPDYNVASEYGHARDSGPALQARTAAAIGKDQVNFPPEIFSNIHPVDDKNWNKSLPYDEEVVHLEEFARLKEVSTLDVERSPQLRDEFQRYLGKKIHSVSPDLYSRYSTEGEHAGRGQPTYYKKAGHVTEYNRNTYPETTNAPELQGRAIGVEKEIKKKWTDYGLTESQAEYFWNEQMNKDPNESVLLKEMKANPNLLDSFFDENSVIEDELSQMTGKVHHSFLRTVNRLSPEGIEIFTDKILKDNSNYYERTRLQEAIYSFMLSYSSVAESSRERGVDLGRAWSDIFFLAVLSHSRSKLQKFEERREKSDNSDIKNQTTQEAIEEKEEKLMVSVSDDAKIGRIITEYMGFTKANSEQKAIIGALAKAIVVDTFQHQENSEVNIEDNKLYSEKKLFEKQTKNITDEAGNKIKDLNVFNLTEAGLDLANRAMPLLNLIMPVTQRRVRTARLKSIESVLKKLKNTPVRKADGTLGDDASLGDVTKMDMMKNQAENTPVRINPKMYDIMHLIRDDFESKMMKYRNDLTTPKALAVYETTLMYELDGPNFQNMKGDGIGNKGVFGGRLGYVYKKDRQGAYVLDEKGEPEELFDASDRIKDANFLNDISFLEDNFNPSSRLGSEFFYDYFWGLNTRLNVSQTIGNYQGAKSSRSLIESAVPFAYQLDNALHVIALKAGIMKRFGYDKLDPLTASDMFDSTVNEWSTIDPFEAEGAKKILQIAGKEEGWASVPSILEAIAFNAELKNPNSKGVYTTGFFTEIDGLTNGMAHSSAQAGDLKTAWRAQMFDPTAYTHWVNNYAEIERLQTAGLIDELAELNVKLELPDMDFTIYMDSYNKVNHEMKENIRRLWGGGKRSAIDIDNVGLPGLITTITDKALRTLMGQAHAKVGKKSGSTRFVAALNILKNRDHPLSRSFVKKPVMIFGYGAGAARIMEAAKLFIDDLLMKDVGGPVWDEDGNPVLDVDGKQVNKPSLATVLNEAGINIDKHLINPIGILLSEAVNQSFGDIKIFANVLSLTAMEAFKQGFPLRIPTKAGYYLNLGGVVYETDDSPGSKTSFQYYPGDFETELKREHGEINKDGTVKKAKAVSRKLLKFFFPFAMKNDYLKAATQITVLLNHADDNINMNQHLVNVHIAKLKEQGYSWDKWLNNLESSTPDVTGNTALHIFDGLLAMPIEAEMHADGLNKVFYQMMLHGKGHASFVEESLTFDLDPSGNRIPDPHRNNIAERKIGSSRWRGYMDFRRLLKEEGEALAVEKEWGTWHPGLDQFAFNWGEYKANEEAAQLRLDLRTIERNRRGLAKAVTNVKQFFWSPESVKQMIGKVSKEWIKNHTKKKKVISS